MQSTMKLRAQAIVLVAVAHVLLALPMAQCYWLNPEIYDSGGLSPGTFPEGFVFGTAASSYRARHSEVLNHRGPEITV